MEEVQYAAKPGLFTRIFGRFWQSEYCESDEIERPSDASKQLTLEKTRFYHITVRRQMVSFADAVSAADGLKRGEQQILNLCSADSQLREKIKDFLAGVNYAQEGTWEELGEHVYLLAPANARVETAPATPRIVAVQN